MSEEEVKVPTPENERSTKGPPYAAPGTAAKHASGVLYQGEFETPTDGTAQAVRLHARALAMTGVPVLLRSFSNTVVTAAGVVESVHLVGLPAEVEAEVGDLTRESIAAARPAIKHLVVRSAEHLKQALMPRGAVVGNPEDIEGQMRLRDGVYNNTIVYSVWERDRIDASIARVLARVGQCWVPCEQNARMLVGSGVPAEKVHVVPHPYRDDDPIHVCTRRHPNAHDGWKRFYSIGRWEPRKGFAELIEAFLTAYAPLDRASLTIKYSGTGMWTGYPTPAEALENAAARSGGRWSLEQAQKKVKLIDGRVKRSQIVSLHMQNNIYVSASHGEAFSFPSFDAKLAGNRLVHIDYGGTSDFYDHFGDVPVSAALGAVHASYRWESDAKWATYDLTELTEALHRAEVPEVFRRPSFFPERYSMAAVGQRMRSLVEKLVPEKKLVT